MAFLTRLKLRTDGPRHFRLTSGLVYRGSDDTIVVPGGFRTDLASVPRVFRGMIPAAGAYTAAAVLHDYLCERGELIGIPRNDADGIFRRVMREEGVSLLVRWSMWAAVRLASFVKTRTGAKDLPAMALVAIGPGLLVVAGGLVAAPFLLAFALAELAARPFDRRH